VGEPAKILDKNAPEDGLPERFVSFKHMFKAHLQNGANMIVCQRVKKIFSFPPELDQMHLLEDPQLMGYGALGEGYRFGNVAYAKLLLQKQRQNLHSGGIAEGVEQLCDLLQRFFGRQGIHTATSF
jgi:hypothetical protein